jgi:hypothetical protein
MGNKASRINPELQTATQATMDINECQIRLNDALNERDDLKYKLSKLKKPLLDEKKKDDNLINRFQQIAPSNTVVNELKSKIHVEHNVIAQYRSMPFISYNDLISLYSFKSIHNGSNKTPWFAISIPGLGKNYLNESIHHITIANTSFIKNMAYFSYDEIKQWFAYLHGKYGKQVTYGYISYENYNDINICEKENIPYYTIRTFSEPREYHSKKIKDELTNIGKSHLLNQPSVNLQSSKNIVIEGALKQDIEEFMNLDRNRKLTTQERKYNNYTTTFFQETTDNSSYRYPHINIVEEYYNYNSDSIEVQFKNAKAFKGINPVLNNDDIRKLDMPNIDPFNLVTTAKPNPGKAHRDQVRLSSSKTKYGGITEHLHTELSTCLSIICEFVKQYLGYIIVIVFLLFVLLYVIDANKTTSCNSTKIRLLHQEKNNSFIMSTNV